MSALLLSAGAFVMNGLGWTLFVHIICYFLFIGSLMLPQSKSFATTMQLGIANLFLSPFQLLHTISNVNIVKMPVLSKLFRFAFLIIPAAIIGFFVLLYSASNPIFEQFLANTFGELFQWCWSFIDEFNPQLIGTWVFGLGVSVYSLVHYTNINLMLKNEYEKDELFRVRKPEHKNFRKLGLKNEWYAAIFLLVALNLLIFVLNLIDIYWVWFNFEWEGEYLKQFVHAGTYVLIFSILVSLVIVLYFFRGKLNFFSRNKSLKLLCYIWLGQNAILAISVVIRNLHYIHYFALASKRIAVMFFIALVLFGIYTVFAKIMYRKSLFYLIRMNAMFALVVLVLSALPNWSSIIIHYNFSHYEQSFVHLDYLASFSEDNISDLDIPLEKLEAMELIQKKLFPFEETYMTAAEFYQRIGEKRKNLEAMESSQSWKEWTLASQHAFDYLEATDE